MSPMIWLTSVETSEPIAIARQRIAMIEQKPLQEANVVAIFLESGQEIRVMESLEAVRQKLSDAMFA